MPTSGNTAFTMSFDQVINRAMHIVGKTQYLLNPDASELTDARQILNTIVHDQENREIFPYQIDDVIQKFVASSTVLGSDGLFYRCVRGHTASAITRPVSGANWALYWLQDASLATPGAWVDGTPYVTSGELTVPDDTLAVWSARVLDDYSNDHSVDVVSMQKFRQVQDRQTDTETWPHTIAFDGKASGGKIFIWPIPIEFTSALVWQKVRKLYSGTAGSDEIDAWSKSLRWLIYELAADLADSFQLDLLERNYLSSKAEKLRKAQVQTHEVDDASGFMPAFDLCD